MNLSRWAAKAAGRAGVKSPRLWLRRLLTLGVLLLAVVITRNFVGTFIARGASMEPTILAGDVLLIARTPRLWHVRSDGRANAPRMGLGRSDLIVLRAGPPERRVIYAKRVVGLPGDVVAMQDNALWVNGTAVDEPYSRATNISVDEATRAMAWQRDYVVDGVDPLQYFPTAGNWGPLKVPAEHYFVLGDNRDNTIDSREFGVVRASDVIGRIKTVVASHDGSCCGLRSLWAGIRWDRMGATLTRPEIDSRLTAGEKLPDIIEQK